MIRHLSILLLLGLSLFIQAQTSNDYIDRYSKIAISEMERTGIPASIKLGQGILESGWGKSTLARKANNHFGIKCHSDWRGKKYYLEDDDYDDNGKLIKSCFRVYKNADASYIAHSEFLRDPKKRFRYGFLFDLDPRDYKAWARGLKSAGYATSPTYAEKLIRVIEQNELYRFDRMTTTEIDFGEDQEFERLSISRLNDVKVTLANNAETPQQIAQRTNTTLRRILKYNENLSSANQKLPKDYRVFLQAKRNNFRGKKKWHYVQKGQTLFDISQLYAVKLSKLQKKNRIPKNREPAVGERIKIRGWFKVSKKDKPKLRTLAEMEALPEEEEPQPETPIEIEIPISSDDDEDFGEELVPELPEEEFIPEEEDEFEEPEVPTTDPLDPPVINEPDSTSPDIPNSDDPEVGVYYTVKKGDTLFSISRRYGTTVEGIKRLNNLSDNTISVGQRLRVF